MEFLLTQLRDKLVEMAPQLAHVITGIQNERYPILKSLESELYPARIELVKIYANSLTQTDEQRIDIIREWGEEAGTGFAKIPSITLDMMLREVPNYRNILGTVIKHEAVEYGISSGEMYEVISILDSALNDITYFFSVPFVRHESDMLRLSRSMVTELSVPIVSINDDTGILPLVGTIDHDRAMILQERTLKNASEKQLKNLIIDLSGLHTTDTFVAQQLFNLFDALSLLGIKPIVSGISPAIAQTLVHLGLTFGRIKSFATLKQALAHIS